MIRVGYETNCAMFLQCDVIFAMFFRTYVLETMFRVVPNQETGWAISCAIEAIKIIQIGFNIHKNTCETLQQCHIKLLIQLNSIALISNPFSQQPDHIHFICFSNKTKINYEVNYSLRSTFRNTSKDTRAFCFDTTDYHIY